ncbi:MAG: PIG-L family deacetylase [Jaaginema sp. PMC 1079.18]|nr:PIG-L family deacetylase [Jaaginema sp. PMC 1080.18]MEC4850837.1 PIG-L family deacetylase [Jaaginema sp. PMC 1079.18]MEC4868352.1 PIG-L family deacetylase [Jaaginema sp. PMC 1078.18]
MPRSNPYDALAQAYLPLLQPSAAIPLPTLTKTSESAPSTAPKVLLFSPHPDDECLTGALPLRLLRECQFNVINVAVTLGSNQERRPERWQELTKACEYLRFGLVLSQEGGLEGIKPKTRQKDPEAWQTSVKAIAYLLQQYQPQIIFCPHAEDGHATHIGTHYLVLDALAKMPADFSCWIVETEYWGAIAHPNLMIESSVADVADLMAATAFHQGEVKRNPYHLRLPAWMADNVRRGGELVGNAGGDVPSFSFATLYCLKRWQNCQCQSLEAAGQWVSRLDNLSTIFDDSPET